MRDFLTDPKKIENKSFQIISKELGDSLPEDESKEILLRVIHATADFDYKDILEFCNNPIEKFNEIIKSGVKIYTDTKMISSGVNKIALNSTGSKLYNFIHDKDVIKEAKDKGITRAIVGINKAIDNENIDIYAIGNSPTALNHLIKRIINENLRVPLIIGCPVGFVGAAESKENLNSLENTSYIRTNGRKGGSTVVTAILNALLYQNLKNG